MARMTSYRHSKPQLRLRKVQRLQQCSVRSLTWRLGWGLLLGSCTPLGLWIYEDPVVTVSQITLELGSGPARSPVTVALAMQNTNDYPLSSERVELSLRLDGMAVGETQRDSTVPMAMDTVSTIALPISLGQAGHTGAVAQSGPRNPYLCRARPGHFQTPIGKRKVPFAQEGSMMFGARSDSSP